MALRELGTPLGGAGGIEITEAASWVALAAAMDGAADGAWGLATNTGRAARMLDVDGDGRGVLVPPQHYDWITDKVSNASGDFFWNLADDLADAQAAGMLDEKTGDGSVSMAAGGPMIVASNTGTANIVFVPTSMPGRWVMVLLVSAIVGTAIAAGNFYLYTGTHIIRLSVTNAAAGGLAWMSGVAEDGAAIGAAALALPAWLLIHVHESDTDSVCEAYDLDEQVGVKVSIEVADIDLDGSGPALYVPYNQSGARTEIDVMGMFQ